MSIPHEQSPVILNSPVETQPCGIPTESEVANRSRVQVP